MRWLNRVIFVSKRIQFQMVRANIILYDGSQRFMSTVTELVLTSRSIDSAMLSQVASWTSYKCAFRVTVQWDASGRLIIKISFADVRETSNVDAAFGALHWLQLCVFWRGCERIEFVLANQLHPESTAHQWQLANRYRLYCNRICPCKQHDTKIPQHVRTCRFHLKTSSHESRITKQWWQSDHGRWSWRNRLYSEAGDLWSSMAVNGASVAALRWYVAVFKKAFDAGT